MITIDQITDHQDYIYKVAYRFTQDPIDAEDLRQDVILNLLENPHQFRGKSKLTTFLYSVIKHRFYYTKRLHINSRTQATHFNDSQSFTPITTDNPESIALHAEQREIVQTAIANLKDSYKQILTMREYDELSYHEIRRPTGHLHRQCEIPTSHSKAGVEKSHRPVTTDRQGRA